MVVSFNDCKWNPNCQWGCQRKLSQLEPWLHSTKCPLVILPDFACRTSRNYKICHVFTLFLPYHIMSRSRNLRMFVPCNILLYLPVSASSVDFFLSLCLTALRAGFSNSPLSSSPSGVLLFSSSTCLGLGEGPEGSTKAPGGGLNDFLTSDGEEGLSDAGCNSEWFFHNTIKATRCLFTSCQWLFHSTYHGKNNIVTGKPCIFSYRYNQKSHRNNKQSNRSIII